MVKILVIEDETPIREEIVDWLCFEGYEAKGASDGRLGLEAILKSPPDLVLCDIAMPEMDGYQVLLEVRAHPELHPVAFIFLTARADRDSMRKGMEMGADDYLTKPFTHEELMRSIHARLEKQARQTQEMQNQADLLTQAFSAERERHLLKARLIGMFSHDFRNPLASILSTTGILRNYDHKLSPERRLYHLNRIEGAVQQLVQMLDEMLIVAEMEKGHLAFHPQPLDLQALLEDLLTDFRLIDRDNHFLHLENNVQAPLNLDAKLLRHLLVNLISNALKYSPSQTTVSLKIYLQRETLVLEVQDQGRGIPPESLPHLFEPFHRASNVQDVKGTGLGLAIVKECVQQHGGEIRVESQLGQGTRFIISLPLVPA
jgi:signal transduction histidine kinase